MECEHNNFNDYFEKCDDCGKGLEEIHDEQRHDSFEASENAGYLICTGCGLEVRRDDEGTYATEKPWLS